MISRLIVVIILQCIQIWNYYVIYLKSIHCYLSILTSINKTKSKIHTQSCICFKYVRMADCGRRRMKIGIKKKKNNREAPCPDQWWIILYTIWEVILRSIINLTFYIWGPNHTKGKGSLTTPRRPSVLHTSIWPSYLFSGNCIVAHTGVKWVYLFYS